MDVEKLKNRIEKEICEVLECDNWNTEKLHWVYELCKIMEMIHEMENITTKNGKA